MGLFSWLFKRKKKKDQEGIFDNNVISTCDVDAESAKHDVISADEPVAASPDTADVVIDEPLVAEPDAKANSTAETDTVEPEDREDAPAEPDAAEPEDRANSPVAPDIFDKKDEVDDPIAEAFDNEPIVETEDPFCDGPIKEKQDYTGRFEINKTRDGKKYFFNLYASNKVVIATSQMYSSAQNALNGVRSVIANAPKAAIEDQSLKNYEPLPYPKWEIFIDNGGKYRFRLNATNGSCVCHSQGYTSKTNCKNGINSIIRSSRNPEIDKAYLIKKD